MRKIRIFYILLTILLLTNYAWAQKSPEQAGSMQDGKFVLKINLDWTEEQMEVLAENFELDSVLINAIIQKDINFINDSTPWNARMISSARIELKKDLTEVLFDEKDKDKEFPGNFEQIILAQISRHTDVFGNIFPESQYGVNDFREDNIFFYDPQDSIGCLTLKGYNNAKSAYLAGSFNQWSTMQLPMFKTENGWRACIKMAPGKHLYKYIVDGRWTTDPNNRNKESNRQGSDNSVVFAYNHTFDLEGYKDAKRVYLAGSFNSWRERELRMQPTKNGWELPLFLGEGTHTYKFIIDRQWITDPDNPNTRSDGMGNLNSVISVGDTILFVLDNYKDANRVYLSGSFNAWNPNELVMEPYERGWRLPYVLGPGNHEYKFVVDGQWIIDPTNPFITGSGDYMNSFLAYKPNYLFELKGYPNAKEVIVSGSFNGWSTIDYKMIFDGTRWIFPIFLKNGRYSYKFIVDGEWILDPGNDLWEQNEYSTGNSVLWIE